MSSSAEFLAYEKSARSSQKFEIEIDDKKPKKSDISIENSKKRNIELLKKELLHANHQNCAKFEASSGQNSGRNSLGPHRLVINNFLDFICTF